MGKSLKRAARFSCIPLLILHIVLCLKKTITETGHCFKAYLRHLNASHLCESTVSYLLYAKYVSPEKSEDFTTQCGMNVIIVAPEQNVSP